MLNEIFKGMDNSAEKINENFKQGSVVDSSKTDGTYLLKFGNGLMLVGMNISVDIPSNTTISVPITYPEPFIARPVVATEVGTYAGVSGIRRVINASQSDESKAVVLVHYEGANLLPLQEIYIWAIGAWK